MIFVGIDAAKNKHDCSILSSEGEVICDSFTFANSRVGFESFLELIKKSCNNNFSNVKVGIESTGHYSQNLISFINQSKLYVVVFNPMIINRSRKANTLRKTKTDKSDARYIAESLFLNRDNSYQEKSYHIIELKSLTRARHNLTKELQPLKNQFRKSIHLLFPEIDGFFSTFYCKSIFALFKELPSAKDIASCNILKLTKILHDNSHGKMERSSAEKLKSLAQSSIAVSNPGESLSLQLLISRIEFILSQQEIISDKIHEILTEINSPITSIPGVGEAVGATILAEIGNINRFDSPNKLLAFAGCEHSTYQSGEYVGTHEHMVKHGSKFLRCALYQAIVAANMQDNIFSQYLDKKRSEGKHYYVAISHAMKKLVRIIYTILKTNQPFKTMVI